MSDHRRPRLPAGHVEAHAAGVLRRVHPPARRAGRTLAADRAGRDRTRRDRPRDRDAARDALLLLAKRAVPDATLIGLDPDPRVLAIAARKARRAGVTLRLDRGYADRLPYPDGSVDRVLSAFMLHHLPADQQHDALREVRRVLAPGGRLHLLDIDGSAPSAAGRLLRLGHLHTAEQHAPSTTGTGRAACARRPRRRARRLREGRPGGRRRGRPRRDAVGRVQLLPRGPLTPYRRYHPPGPASAVAAAGPHDPGA